MGKLVRTLMGAFILILSIFICFQFAFTDFNHWPSVALAALILLVLGGALSSEKEETNGAEGDKKHDNTLV